MENLRLYPRYARLTRRMLPSPRIVSGTPRELARLLRAAVRGAGGRIRVLADENTARATPELVDALDDAAGITVLPGSPPVIPDIRIADELSLEAGRDCSAIVAIGGGTIVDLAKYAAQVSGLELVCVPTAASVDAFTSARSALRIDGYHRTPDARVPDVIMCCPQVIEAAPDALTLAGLGDLTAKLIARLDWQLAAIVTGEPCSARESEWSARAAGYALARLRHAGLREAAMPALDALLITGRAMHLAGSSRPAASSEHTMAHLWEVALGDGMENGYHGLLAVRAVAVVVNAYRWITDRLKTAQRGGLPPYAAEAGWQERVPDDMKPFLGKMLEETGGRDGSPAAIDRRRDAVHSSRERIIAIAEHAIPEAERALDALDRAGIGAWLPLIPGHWVLRAVQWVRYLRNRYSMFDLAFEMGWEPELLDHLDLGKLS